MDRYKLMNTIKKDLLNDPHHYKSIKKVRYSRTLLRNLFNTYDCIEFCWLHYCCYGEDKNCWIDEDVNWMYDYSQKTINKKLQQRVFSLINKLPKSGYNLKIFITETDNHITVVIPLRNIYQYDLYISFKK